jgi:hypothetical protein
MAGDEINTWKVILMTAWLSKWGPLAGTLSGILFIACFVIGSGNAPDTSASGQQIIQWYTQHPHQVYSDSLLGVSMFFLILFAAVLPRRIRRGEAWLANAAVAGAVCTGIGGTILLGIDLVLARDAKHLTVASAQTLSLLQNDFALPWTLGIALFGVLTGLAVVAGRILPAWMGWVLFALGVVALVPPLSWFAFLLSMLWVLVAGIWMTVQAPPAVTADPVTPQERVLA